MTDRKIKLEPFFPLLLRNLPIHSVFFTKDQNPKNYFFGGVLRTVYMCGDFVQIPSYTSTSSWPFQSREKEKWRQRIGGQSTCLAFFSLQCECACAVCNTKLTDNRDIHQRLLEQNLQAHCYACIAKLLPYKSAAAFPQEHRTSRMKLLPSLTHACTVLTWQ